MNLKNIYLSTLMPEFPNIYNYNNQEFKRYLDVIYNETSGVVVVGVNTTKNVKASSGEFVNIVVDNLTVKSQYMNLYDNNTTADYNFYRMYVDPVTTGRDPCTYGIDTSIWNVPYEPSAYKIVDVNKPYYKLSNANPIFLRNNNLSQVVGIYFDASLSGIAPLQVLLDPCSGKSYVVDTSMAGDAYKEFICVAYDPSWGSTWTQYK